MPGFTNKGKTWYLEITLQGGTLVTNYYIALITSANVPDADTNLMSDLTEINTGNGYTSGGYQLTPDATDFDNLTEDDTNNRGSIQIKDIVWNASGGTIPSSGDGARYAVLTDDNGTVANREVYGFFDLQSNRAVSDGSSITLRNCEIRLNES